MMRKASKRVCFAPDNINAKPAACLKSTSTKNGAGRRSHRQIPCRSSTGSTPVRLFRYVRVNVAKALGLLRKRKPSVSVNPRSSNTAVAPQQRFVPPRDSHHSETFEDCIEFVNSSYRKSI